MARLKHHMPGDLGSQINVTLDSNAETFPLNQSLYFDFSHDTNIISILTAFGLRQFADLEVASSPGNRNFTTSQLVPAGARLDIELIQAPQPLAADRSGYLREGGLTKYVHFILNQRTIPLGASFAECDASRVDGWCEFDTFVRIQEEMPKKAKYDEACFGEYIDWPYGEVRNGSPP